MSQTKINVGMIDASSIGDAKVLQGDGAWVTASAGALAFISTTDISNAATYDFTAFNSSKYEHYQFFLQNLVPATDGVHLWARTSTDGGSSFESGTDTYTWGHYNNLIAWGALDTKMALTGITTSGYYMTGNDAGYGIAAVITIYAPHVATFTQVVTSPMLITAEASSTAKVITVNQGAAMRYEAADVDGFRLLFSSGNIASGTITAYGIANS